MGCDRSIAVRALDAVVVVIFVAAIALFTGTARAVTLASPRDDLRYIDRPNNGFTTIMPLGDSITRGFASTDSNGYRLPLYNMLAQAGWNFSFVGRNVDGGPSLPQKNHEGWDGHRTRDLATLRVPGAMAANPANITLLMAGTNDCFFGDVPDPAGGLNTLIETIFRHNPTTNLYVANIIPIYDFVAQEEYESVIEYNAQIPGVVQSWAAQGKRIHFVDMYSGFRYEWLWDGVHPTDTGYNHIANRWYNALERRRFTQPTLAPEPGAVTAAIALCVMLLSRRCPRV